MKTFGARLAWLLISASTLHVAHGETPDGRAVFERSCASCHGEGRYMAGTRQLEANYQGARPALLEQRTDLTPEFVKALVRSGLNVMPRFRKTEVSDAELQALALYLSRNNPSVKP